MLLQRAGVSYSDAVELVRQQAKLEGLSRKGKVERLLKACSVLRADVPANAPISTQELYDVWDNMKSNDNGVSRAESLWLPQ